MICCFSPDTNVNKDAAYNKASQKLQNKLKSIKQLIKECSCSDKQRRDLIKQLEIFTNSL